MKNQPIGGLFDDPNASFTAGPGDADARPARKPSKPTKRPDKVKAVKPVVPPVVVVEARPPMTPAEAKAEELDAAQVAEMVGPALPGVVEAVCKIVPVLVHDADVPMTREAWLIAGVKKMVPLFESKGYKVPTVRVSCGWPSSRGLSTKSRAVGECWPGDASSDGKNQIFVSPFCSTGTAPSEVLATLVHEVVHAVVGLENKHGKAFKKCALAVGLDGKMTSTTAGPDLMVTIGEWEKQLGPYPHSPLNPLRRPTKKQGVRMLKMTCKECGYVARTAKKWLDEAGPCHCPKHGVMDVEPKETEDESE